MSAILVRAALAGALLTAAACARSETEGSAGAAGGASAGYGARGETADGRQSGPGPEVADPLQVGLDPQRLALVDSLILRAIADSATPGAALAVGRHGRLVRLRGYGRLDWNQDSSPVTDSSIYDLASLTKVVGTTTAAMIMMEEGKLDLEARVSRYLPWWIGGGKESATVLQLLLHRAGLPPFKPFWRELRGREAYTQAIAALPAEYSPGDSTLYSDIGLMALGFAIEVISGAPLDEFLARAIFKPLGMRDTGFRPDSSLLRRIAPTEVDTVFRGIHLHGVVHDENAYALGGVAGHAGLFSSARDLAVFAQMMLDGGTVGPCPDDGLPCHVPRREPIRLVERGTITRFTASYDAASNRALGWETPAAGSSAGGHLTSRAFGHTGFTGTSLWIDPELDLFVVLLTNRVNPSRENARIGPLRRTVHDAVATAIVDRGGGWKPLNR